MTSEKDIKLSYYQRNKARHKAVCSLWYLMNKEKANEASKEYYRQNSDKWRLYNLHNHAANTGTGLLGGRRNDNPMTELKLIEKEMKRLGIRR